MRTIVSTVVLSAALFVAACEPPVIYRDSQLVVSVAARPAAVVVFAAPTGPTAFVDIHYRINGSPQLNLRMTEGPERWRFRIPGLSSGDVIDFFLTHERDGAAVDTPWLRYRLDPTAATATPAPSGTPTPTTTSAAPTATPAATATPPAPTPIPTPPNADGLLSPTDYSTRLTFEGGTATLHVRTALPLGPSTATVHVEGEPERSLALQPSGAGEWAASFPARAGARMEYRFLLAYSDGTNPLFLRSSTRAGTVGTPLPSRDLLAVVETAGRFRDRHENERRFEPFVAGYFDGSTFSVLVLDFGDALDVTVAVADEADFVDIKLFDRDLTPPHLRADEVRADYRVAARMLGQDDPETGARTWHWRQERDELRDVDLSPGHLVDFEFTIRRAESRPAHAGSNGQYYTAIFRHRMGEAGLTEVLDASDHRPGDAASVYVISEPEWSFAQAARNLNHEELLTFLRGKRLFDRDLAHEDTSLLGPRYDATSCVACHPRDGSAAPHATTPGLTVLVGTGDRPDPQYGAQLQRRAVAPLAPEGRISLSWSPSLGTLPDGTAYELVDPSASVHDALLGALDPNAPRLRVAPRLVALGLLEAVPAEEIVAWEDADDADGDGISGRARFEPAGEGGTLELARFGWKASVATLRQQVALAFLRDLGVTTDLLPENDETPGAPLSPQGPPELTAGELDDVTDYVATLGVPMRLDVDQPVVTRGRSVFDELGCAACHRPTLHTSSDAPRRSARSLVLHPYSDLLLHDMGPGLADPAAADPAWSREWRTPPLWGLGRTEAVSGHTRYLHDGRARNLMEAVLWHGGEAAAARDGFAALSASDREALLAFLRSL